MAKKEDIKKANRYKKGYLPSRYIDYLINLYRQFSNPSRLQQMRRGYKSRLYSPSRRGNPGSSSNYRPRTVYTSKPHYQPEPQYKPMRKQPVTRSSYQPWQEPSKYTPPITRVQPDVEQTIKKLEKRLEKVLQEQVHESLETELNELKALAKREKNEDTPKAESENVAPDTATQKLENMNETSKDLECGETFRKSADENNPKLESEAGERIEKQKLVEDELESELPNMDELYNEEDELEWLREEIEDVHLNETVDNFEALKQENSEPALEQPISPLEALEPKILEAAQQPSEMPLIDSAPLETTPEIGPEQMADLEPLLDQIEPLEIEPLQPIEATPIPGILPEIMPENIEDAAEPSEAAEGQVY